MVWGRCQVKSLIWVLLSSWRPLDFQVDVSGRTWIYRVWNSVKAMADIQMRQGVKLPPGDLRFLALVGNNRCRATEIFQTEEKQAAPHRRGSMQWLVYDTHTRTNTSVDKTSVSLWTKDAFHSRSRCSNFPTSPLKILNFY